MSWTSMIAQSPKSTNFNTTWFKSKQNFCYARHDSFQQLIPRHTTQERYDKTDIKSKGRKFVACYAHSYREHLQDTQFLVLLGWSWKRRLLWQSTASTEASFHSSPMCNPTRVRCLYVRLVRSYCHSNSACFVSVRALCCIFIVPSPGCKYL